ncbi:MAG: hypothetical protein JWM01_2904, partial [Arthrobacter sp.]|nr:hypothetical protein [Arthrobacter sp.]
MTEENTGVTTLPDEPAGSGPREYGTPTLTVQLKMLDGGL